ncbi:MAG: rhomboid family intramembrane serine protease [Planctomycetota bacterium]
MIFLPFGDFPNPPKPQWVTRILIGINVVVYLLVNVPLQDKAIDVADVEANRPMLEEMFRLHEPTIQERYPQSREAERRQAFLAGVSKYDLVVHKYGYRPGRPSLIALFLCMFLHGDFFHLFGNMLYLWIYGDNVEYRLGKIPFLIAYLGTGVVATISFSLMAASSLVPLVGASGAISGALGFYLIWFPYNYVRVFIWIFFFVQVIHVRAALILALYLVLDNILPLLADRGGTGGGVAHAAHIGGFIAGAGLAWLFNSVKGRVEPPRPDGGTAMRPGPRPAQRVRVETAQDHAKNFEWAVEHDQMEDAAHAFASIAREGGRTPNDPAVFTLANWLYERGFTSDAAAVFRYYTKNYPKGSDLDRVNLGLGVLLSRRMAQPQAARQYLLAAIDLAGEDSQIAETARAELDRIGG